MRAFALALCALAILLSSGCSPGVSGGFILTDADRRQAIERFKEALAQEPDDWMLYRRMGMVYFDLKEYAQAAASLEKVQELSPGEPLSLLYLGLSRIGKGERKAGLDGLAVFRWPGKFYHQKYVQEEAVRLRKHPEEPSEEVIRDILDELEKGRRAQLEVERGIHGDVHSNPF